MPEFALRYFLGRTTYRTPEQQAVVSFVIEHPDRFPPSVLRYLGTDDQEDAWAKQLRRSSVLRSGETLEVVMEIQDQVRGLSDVVRDGFARKRGIFG